MGYQFANGADCTEPTASLSPEDTRPAAAATTSAAAATHAVRSMTSGLSSCSLHTVEVTEVPATLQCVHPLLAVLSCWGEQQRPVARIKHSRTCQSCSAARDEAQLALVRLLPDTVQSCNAGASEQRMCLYIKTQGAVLSGEATLYLPCQHGEATFCLPARGGRRSPSKRHPGIQVVLSDSGQYTRQSPMLQCSSIPRISEVYRQARASVCILQVELCMNTERRHLFRRSPVTTRC